MFDSDDDFQCENFDDESFKDFLEKLPAKIRENPGKLTDFKHVSFLARGSFGKFPFLDIYDILNFHGFRRKAF